MHGWASVAVAASVILTLLSGLHGGTPVGLVGAVWYGFPLAWLRRLVVAPQYYPWAVDYTGLVLDVVFWFVVAASLFLVTRYVLHRASLSLRAARSR